MKMMIVASVRSCLVATLPWAVFALAGCGAGQPAKSNQFFTSGSKEADQRADQRMAKDEQLKGTGGASGGGTPAAKEENQTLYLRLGGAQGLDSIVGDFVNRSIADPRVNWERKDIKQGGFSFHRSDPVSTWTASPQNVETLKKHLVQFLALATGGPVKYDGGEMTHVHAGMHISNAEFDASVGDMKASLDKLQIGAKEQKELLAILESTRAQIVENR